MTWAAYMGLSILFGLGLGVFCLLALLVHERHKKRMAKYDRIHDL